MKATVCKSSWHGGRGKGKPSPCEGAVWDEAQGRWFLEVNSLDDLTKLNKIVFALAWDKAPYDLDIEIYDDYRE